MDKTKKQLLKIAQAGLRSEYGFAPGVNKIVLLEASGNGDYILFRVGSHTYAFGLYTWPRVLEVKCNEGLHT